MRILLIFLFLIILSSCNDNAVVKGHNKKENFSIKNFDATLKLPEKLDITNPIGIRNLSLTWKQDIGRNYKIEEYDYGFTTRTATYNNLTDGKLDSIPATSNIELRSSYRITEKSTGAFAELNISPIFYNEINNLTSAGTTLATNKPNSSDLVIVLTKDEIIEFDGPNNKIISNTKKENNVSLNSCIFSLDKVLLPTTTSNDFNGLIDYLGNHYPDSNSLYYSRNNPGCTLVNDNIAIILGGKINEVVNNEIFSVKQIAPGEYNWEKLKNAPWNGREKMQAVKYHNKIWLIGGVNGEQIFNDIWVSDIISNASNKNELDLTNWHKLSDTPFTPRYDFKALVYNDKLWVFGGKDSSGDHVKDAIWYTQDGINWVNVLTNFQNFSSVDLIKINELLLQFGGITINGATNKIYQIKQAITMPSSSQITKIISNTPHSIDLNFKPISNATNYNLRYLSNNEDINLNPTEINQIEVAKYKHENLLESNLYQYQVKACNENGCSSWSNNATTYTNLTTPTLTLRESADNNSITTNSINIELSRLIGTTYEDSKTKLFLTFLTNDINEIKELQNINLQKCSNKNTCSYDITGLLPGKNYNIVYQVTNPIHQKEKILQITTFATPIINFITSNQDNITLTWDPVIGAKEYKLLRSNKAISTDVATISVGTNNSYSDSNLTPATNYEYNLIACNTYNKVISCITSATTEQTTQVPMPDSVKFIELIKNNFHYNATFEIKSSKYSDQLSYLVKSDDGLLSLSNLNNNDMYEITNLLPQNSYTLKFFSIFNGKESINSINIPLKTPDYSNTQELIDVQFLNNIIHDKLTIGLKMINNEERSLEQLDWNLCKVTVKETPSSSTSQIINKNWKCNVEPEQTYTDNQQVIDGLKYGTSYDLTLAICKDNNNIDNCLLPTNRDFETLNDPSKTPKLSEFLLTELATIVNMININTLKLDFKITNYDLSSYKNTDDIITISVENGIAATINKDLASFDKNNIICNTSSKPDAVNIQNTEINTTCQLFFQNFTDRDFLVSINFDFNNSPSQFATKSIPLKFSVTPEYKVIDGKLLTIKATDSTEITVYKYTKYGTPIVGEGCIFSASNNIKQTVNFNFTVHCSNSTIKTNNITDSVSFDASNTIDDIQNGLTYSLVVVNSDSGKLTKVSNFNDINLLAWQPFNQNISGLPFSLSSKLYFFTFPFNPLENIDVAEYDNNNFLENEANFTITNNVERNGIPKIIKGKNVSGDDVFYALVRTWNNNLFSQSTSVYQSSDGGKNFSIISNSNNSFLTQEVRSGFRADQNQDYSFSYFNDKLWLIGGCRNDDPNSDSGQLSNIINYFDLNHLTGWATITANLPKTLAWHSAVEYNDELYIIGGIEQLNGNTCSLGDYQHNQNDIYNLAEAINIDKNDNITDSSITINSTNLINLQLIANNNDLYVINMNSKIREILKTSNGQSFTNIIKNQQIQTTSILNPGFIPGLISQIDKKLPFEFNSVTGATLFNNKIYLYYDGNINYVNKLNNIDRY